MGDDQKCLIGYPGGQLLQEYLASEVWLCWYRTSIRLAWFAWLFPIIEQKQFFEAWSVLKIVLHQLPDHKTLWPQDRLEYHRVGTRAQIKGQKGVDRHRTLYTVWRGAGRRFCLRRQLDFKPKSIDRYNMAYDAWLFHQTSPRNSSDPLSSTFRICSSNLRNLLKSSSHFTSGITFCAKSEKVAT